VNEILTLAELEGLAPLGIEDEPAPTLRPDDDARGMVCEIFTQSVDVVMDPTGQRPPVIRTEMGPCGQAATHAMYSNCSEELERMKAGEVVAEHINFACTRHADEASREAPGTHLCPANHHIHIARVVPIAKS
jgi:hypothetical protein